MDHTVATYRARPERLAEHEALIRGVFAALAEAAPPGVAYRAARLADGVSFVHVADADPDTTRLSALPAFQAYLADLPARCVAPPDVQAATLLGSFSNLTRVRA